MPPKKFNFAGGQMRKMLHDADRWDKAWFRKLGPVGRDIWNWILDRSKYGIWEVDLERIGFELGYPVELAQIRKVFGNKMYDIGDGKVFLPAAVVFQYGKLSEACKPHIPVILELNRLRVFELYEKELVKGFETLEKKNINKKEEKEQKEEPGVKGEVLKPRDPALSIDSAHDLLMSIPLITRVKWEKDYPIKGFIAKEAERCFDYHCADPSKRPQTHGQWAKKLHSWLIGAWENRGDVTAPSLDDVDLNGGRPA